MSKSLKSLHRELKSFAAELSSKNIRYRIGKQALIIPFFNGSTEQHAFQVKPHLVEYTLIVTYEELPGYIHPVNKTRMLRISCMMARGHYFGKWWEAFKHVEEILKSEGAWQKKGIDTRGE